MATVPHRLPSMRRDSVSATRCVGSPGTLGAFAFTSASVGIGDGLGLGFACAARSAGAPKTMMLRDNIRKVSFPEREKSKSERGTRGEAESRRTSPRFRLSAHSASAFLSSSRTTSDAGERPSRPQHLERLIRVRAPFSPCHLLAESLVIQLPLVRRDREEISRGFAESLDGDRKGLEQRGLRREVPEHLPFQPALLPRQSHGLHPTIAERQEAEEPPATPIVVV